MELEWTDIGDGVFRISAGLVPLSTVKDFSLAFAIRNLIRQNPNRTITAITPEFDTPGSGDRRNLRVYAYVAITRESVT